MSLEEEEGHTVGGQPCNSGGRDWSDESTSRGMPRIVGKHQKLEEAKKNPSLHVSEGAWPCQHLDFNVQPPGL